MKFPNSLSSLKVISLTAIASAGLVPLSAAEEKPIKVIIMSGQSNMVGFGNVTSGGSRWGDQFTGAVVSAYEGKYDTEIDYDKKEPLKTLELEKFGGVNPTPYPEEGDTYVTRGFFQPEETGIYKFKPGHGDYMHNIMEVDGKEVHRKEAGGERIFTPIKLSAGEKVPFKITYLTDDAGGLGWIERMDLPGSLSAAVGYGGKYPYLMNDKNEWVKRDDVYYKGVIAAVGSDWLNPLAGGGRIGPELGFGHVVGNHLDEPVLLLKSSQGNRALGWDFLPPGSERYEYNGRIYAGYKDSPMSWEKGTEPEPIKWYAGKEYDECFTAAHEVLENFDENFPHWKGRGYEIVGFAWWQGDKDRYDEGLAARYEKNMVHLIRSLRTEFKAPDAKFVLATLGQTPKENAADKNEKMILDAQLAVAGDSGKYPEFEGNVATVYTHPMSQGGSSNAHYSRNAEVYMDVGLAMGEAMTGMLEKE